ncbi:MAG: Trk system potassium transporter TrkA [Parachlamydiales bacterium]
MKVVIVGAGDIGIAIASLLSAENYDVILVDQDAHRLEKASEDLDIATTRGSGTDWKVLEELQEFTPSMLIAVTDSDEINLTCCAIAKALAYPITVARVRQASYVSKSRLDFGRIFSVDHFVSPEYLAALDVATYALNLGAVKVQNFAMGSVQMRTLTVPQKWKRAGIPLAKLDLPTGVLAGLIHRRDHEAIIFPHGEDSFRPGDEVTLVGQTEPMEEIHEFFGMKQKRVDSAVIIGGGLIGTQVARLLLAHNVRVRIIERDRQLCTLLAERFPEAIVIHHDGSNLEFLRSQRIGDADITIAATRSDETNVFAALLAQEAGAKQVVAVVSEAAAVATLTRHGITHIVSPRSVAANQIIQIAQSESITSSTTLYENRAKVLELTVSMRSKIVGIPLAHLAPYFPKEFLIAVIQNRGRTLIADGRRILCPGDTALVITSPKQVDEVLSLF